MLKRKKKDGPIGAFAKDAVMEKYRIGTLQGHRTFYAWNRAVASLTKD